MQAWVDDSRNSTAKRSNSRKQIGPSLPGFCSTVSKPNRMPMSKLRGRRKSSAECEKSTREGRDDSR